MLVRRAGFATSLLSTLFEVCGVVDAVAFRGQNAYKMAHGDQNTTLEPLNL